MALDGRITVDVLFQDTDGTTSLKVVSLEDTTQYDTGKVAVVTGTVGTSGTTIVLSPLTGGYRDATGSLVSFTSTSRYVFAATPAAQLETGGTVIVRSVAGRPAASDGNVPLTVKTTSGTASFTLVLYGT